MGTWGPGVYQNDHALDLLWGEVDHLVEQMEKVFALDNDPIRSEHGAGLAFDDIEGPLLYIHILALLAREAHIQHKRLDWAAAERWKKKYLDAFNSTFPDEAKGSEYFLQRKDAITQEFDALIAGLARHEVE